MKKRLTDFEREVKAKTLTPADQMALVSEIRMLRKLLAQKTAECIWLEGGDFAKIDIEVKQWGFKIVAMPNGHDPKLEEIKR